VPGNQLHHVAGAGGRNVFGREPLAIELRLDQLAQPSLMSLIAVFDIGRVVAQPCISVLTALALGREAVRMKAVRHLVVAGALLAAPPADAQRLLAAVFLFEMDDSGLHAATPVREPGERVRLGRLDELLVVSLERSEQYAPVAVALDPAWPSLRTCGGCEVEAARRVGAQVTVTGWVQKVSDVHRTINVVVRDVATGGRVAGGSADILGDTEESWTSGLAELLRNQILDNPTAK